MSSNLVFVGQGPNKTAWHRGLEAGKSLRPADPDSFARDYCARVAITGAVGGKLAAMLEIEPRAMMKFRRINLNARWNGKSGKGDLFDRAEAETTARLLIETAPGPTLFVLLGAEVGRAFGVRGDWLGVTAKWRDVPRAQMQFLLFPHPSGINLWWNDSFNVYRAKKRLREFVALANDTKK